MVQNFARDSEIKSIEELYKYAPEYSFLNKVNFEFALFKKQKGIKNSPSRYVWKNGQIKENGIWLDAYADKIGMKSNGKIKNGFINSLNIFEGRIYNSYILNTYGNNNSFYKSYLYSLQGYANILDTCFVAGKVNSKSGLKIKNSYINEIFLSNSVDVIDSIIKSIKNSSFGINHNSIILTKKSLYKSYSKLTFKGVK